MWRIASGIKQREATPHDPLFPDGNSLWRVALVGVRLMSDSEDPEEQETSPLIGLDNKPLAAETKHIYRVAGAHVAPKTYSPETKKFLKYRQELRRRALIAKGHKVLVRKNGVGPTVYKGERGDDYAWWITTPIDWDRTKIIPDPPILRPNQRKRRVDRYLETHPGEVPRDEVD
jgi:hypothetical protein